MKTKSTDQMKKHSINNDHCAADYEQRYSARSYPKVRSALLSLAHQPGVHRVLEVGCGTGHWLRELRPSGISGLGLDPSIQMLRQARLRDPNAAAVCALAAALPFANRFFDLVFCVNAFHHFGQPDAFVSEAGRVLGHQGRLAIFGLDPHESETDWYLYRYFLGTYERDLERYKPRQEIAQMLTIAGFEDIASQQIERLSHSFTGIEVLSDPFLKKNSTSQLSLVSDADYATGLQRIHDAIRDARAVGRESLFRVQLSLGMVSGRLR
jgi:ubiquinone/menaquinone biosynthesis C-methylase UbiE